MDKCGVCGGDVWPETAGKGMAHNCTTGHPPSPDLYERARSFIAAAECAERQRVQRECCAAGEHESDCEETWYEHRVGPKEEHWLAYWCKHCKCAYRVFPWR